MATIQRANVGTGGWEAKPAVEPRKVEGEIKPYVDESVSPARGRSGQGDVVIDVPESGGVPRRGESSESKLEIESFGEPANEHEAEIQAPQSLLSYKPQNKTDNATDASVFAQNAVGHLQNDMQKPEQQSGYVPPAAPSGEANTLDEDEPRNPVSMFQPESQLGWLGKQDADSPAEPESNGAANIMHAMGNPQGRTMNPPDPSQRAENSDADASKEEERTVPRSVDSYVPVTTGSTLSNPASNLYRIADSIAKSIKDELKAEETTSGQGARIYAKILGRHWMRFGEIGIGEEDFRFAFEMNPEYIYRLMQRADRSLQIGDEGLAYEDVLRFFRTHNVEVPFMKPPHAKPDDAILLRMRILDSSDAHPTPRGLVFHPVMAKMLTADYDGDAANLSLNPTDWHLAKSPMAWVVRNGKLNIDEDFLHFIPLVETYDEEGNPLRSIEGYIRNVMFNGIIKLRTLGNLSKNSPLHAIVSKEEDVVSAIRQLQDIIEEVASSADTTITMVDYHTGSDVEVDISDAIGTAYGIAIIAMRDVCEAQHADNPGRAYRQFEDMVQAFYEDSERRWRLAEESKYDYEEMPEPVEYGDLVYETIVRDMVTGSAPNNDQEFRMRYGFYLGKASKGNPPFRCNAAIAKRIRDDARLKLGHDLEFEVVVNDSGETVYEFDIGNADVVQTLYESTAAYAVAYKMSGERRLVENRRLYNMEYIRNNVKKKVGFPSDYEGKKRFVKWLMAFIKEYNRQAEIVNQANARFLTDMKLQYDESTSVNKIRYSAFRSLFLKDILGSRRSARIDEEFVFHVTLGDVVGPIRDIYGDCPMTSIFCDIVGRKGSVDIHNKPYGKFGDDPIHDFHLANGQRIENHGRIPAAPATNGKPYGRISEADLTDEERETVGRTGEKYVDRVDENGNSVRFFIQDSGYEGFLTEEEQDRVGYAGDEDYYYYIEDRYLRMTVNEFIANNAMARPHSMKYKDIPVFEPDTSTNRTTIRDFWKINKLFIYESQEGRYQDFKYNHRGFWFKSKQKPPNGYGVKTNVSSGMEYYMLFALADERTSKASSYCKRQYGGAVSDQNNNKIGDNKGNNVPRMMVGILQDLNTLIANGELERSQTAADDLISMLYIVNKDVFKHFGLISPAGWIDSPYGKELLDAVKGLSSYSQYAKNVSTEQRDAELKIADILFRMQTQYYLRFFIKARLAVEQSKDGKALSESEELMLNDERNMAVAKLAAASTAWRTVMKFINGNPDSRTVLEYLVKVGRAGDSEYTVIGNKRKKNYLRNFKLNAGKQFWAQQDPSTFDLEQLIFDSEMDLDTKCRIISDLVRVDNHDITFNSFEVPLQMTFDGEGEFSFMHSDTESFFAPQSELASKFKKWSKRRWNDLVKDIEDTASEYQDAVVTRNGHSEFAMIAYLETCAEQPWKLVESNDDIYADGLMSVYFKLYGQSEKAQQHLWTNALYSMVSFVRNGGFFNGFFKADDRAIGVLHASKVDRIDIIRALIDPNFNTTVYDDAGHIVQLNQQTLLGQRYAEHDIGRSGLNKAIWKFFRENPRIAATVLPRHKMCVSTDADGSGFIGRQDTIGSTFKNYTSTYDDVAAAQFYLFDKPRFAAICNLIIGKKNMTSITGRERAKNAAHDLALAIYGEAYKVSIGNEDVEKAASNIMARFGISKDSLEGAFKDTRAFNSFVDRMVKQGIMTDDIAEDTTAELEAMDVLEDVRTFLEQYVNMFVELSKEENTAFTKGPGIKLGNVSEDRMSKSGGYYGVTALGVAAYWDTVQEMIGAKTQVTTGIEGTQTWLFDVQAAVVSGYDNGRDAFADLEYIARDIEEFENPQLFDGAMTVDGKTITIGEDGTIENYDELVTEAGGETIVIVPAAAIEAGFVIRDRNSKMLSDYQMTTVNTVTSEHRSFDAEEGSLKARKNISMSDDSVSKLDGKLSGFDFEKFRNELQNDYDSLGIEPVPGAAPVELVKKLAEHLRDENIALGYEKFKMEDYYNLASMMLIIDDNGTVVVRSLEMIYAAIHANLDYKLQCGEIDEEGYKEQAIEILLDTNPSTCVGSKSGTSKWSITSYLAPAKSSNSYNALNPRESSVQRRLDALAEISETQKDKDVFVPDDIADEVDEVLRSDVFIYENDPSKDRRTNIWKKAGEAVAKRSKGKKKGKISPIDKFLDAHPTLANFRIVGVVGIVGEGEELLDIKKVYSDDLMSSLRAEGRTKREIQFAEFAMENGLVERLPGGRVDWNRTIERAERAFHEGGNVSFALDWNGDTKLEQSIGAGSGFAVDNVRDGFRLKLIGDKNAWFIGKNVTGSELSSILNEAYSLGITVMFEDEEAVANVFDASPEFGKDMIVLEDGAGVLEMLSIRMNGGEGHPTPFKFAVEQVPSERLAVSVVMPDDFFRVGDAGAMATSWFRDRIINLTNGIKKLAVSTIFSQAVSGSYQISSGISYDYDIVEPELGTIRKQLQGHGAAYFIDYGMPVQNTIEYRQRVHNVNRAIDRWLERVENGEADEHGMIVNPIEPLESWECVGFVAMQHKDAAGRMIVDTYAPIIPFDVVGAKNVPDKFVLTSAPVITQSTIEIPYRGAGTPSYVKVLDSSAPSNKMMILLSDVINAKPTLKNGLIVDYYMNRQTVGGRNTVEEERLASICSLMFSMRVKGYNFALVEDAFPDNPDIKYRLLRGHRNDGEAITIEEWDELYHNLDFRFHADPLMNEFIAEEVLKFLNNGANPTDMFVSEIAPEMQEFDDFSDPDIHRMLVEAYDSARKYNTCVQWENRATVEDHRGYQDMLLRWLHMMDETVPNGINDHEETVDGIQRPFRVNDDGIIEWLVPRPHVVFRKDGEMDYDWNNVQYIWAQVFIGPIGMTEDTNMFSSPNVIGASAGHDLMMASLQNGGHLGAGLIKWGGANISGNQYPQIFDPMVEVFTNAPDDGIVGYDPDQLSLDSGIGFGEE